jgi:hypothetical protein
MPRHRARTTRARPARARPGRLPALAVAAAVAAVALVAAALLGSGATSSAPVDDCAALRVVVAESFAPVLDEVAPAVASGPGCGRLDVTVADGREAVERAHGADLWISDDVSWSGVAAGPALADGPPAVVATSPLLLVTDEATAAVVRGAGAGWRGLADLVGDPASGVRLVARDPAGTGEGLLGLGAVGEAVWLDEGMDASADALAAAVPRTRVVPGREAAMPGRPSEVGLVAERTLLTGPGRPAAGTTVLAPADRTAELRYGWHPSADAAADPGRAAALARLAAALAGPEADGPLARAGLRRPGGGPPPGSPEGMPAVVAPAFDVLGPHHVDHVFATWYPGDRRAQVLVAVDVSGSMWARPASADTPLIDVVRRGVGTLADLLPDASRFALWEFGSELDPPLDHRVLLDHGDLAGARRTGVAAAVARLTPIDTGTGLHDTVLAAYLSARDAHREGTPSHVVVFTDGRDEADDLTVGLDGLTRALADAADPQRPVQLSVITFGDGAAAETLTAALEPVGGYVDHVRTADEVAAAFIHVAAGGLHG